MDSSDWFHCHVHSEYSVLDGMAKVHELAYRAATFGQPALALTDHGVMSGTFQLYKECKANDIIPFPGIEAYVVDDTQDKKAKRYHITLLALNLKGYRALAKLSSKSHLRENYHFRPRISLADLAAMSDSGETQNIACLTGCYFGLVVQSMVESGYDSALRHIKMLRAWFPHLFVEVQHHNIKRTGAESKFSDDSLALQLLAAANEAGVTCMATQDAHYLRTHDKPAHTMMKSLVSAALPEEAGFPGDSYHLATTQWVKSHYQENKKLKEIWEQSLDTAHTLLALNEMSMPALDKYKYHVPDIHGTDSQKELENMSLDWLASSDYAGNKVYQDRISRELKIIDTLGMSNYFLLVSDYVSWARGQGILVNARGSANASLVCLAAGITSTDPVKWKLLFERFLSLDRVKPPDIDIDVEDIRRDDLVDYIKRHYDVCHIGTYNTLGIDSEGKGSVVVSYFSARRRQLGDKFYSTYRNASTLEDIDNGAPKDSKPLRHLARMKVRKAPGVHAAGLVVAGSTQSIPSYLPTMLIPSSNTTVTQMTMDCVEDAGYVKIDMLGLRSLTTMRRAIELSGFSSISDIPLNDKATFAMLRKGRPDNGIFQFEGYSLSRGLKEIKVKSISDMAVTNALYRPATMHSGMTAEYVSRANGSKPVSYLHDIHKKHTADTLGIIVYQEQVISIMRDLGVTVEDLNKMLKAIKSSNSRIESAEDNFTDMENRFRKLCEAKGMTDRTTDYVWRAVEGFSEYGFNKAHAITYAILGYQMAYLKVHYPLEFMTAVLETTCGSPKETKYVAEARYMGITLLGVNVNISAAEWSIDRKRHGIRKGLTSVKGIGYSAADEIVSNAPYSSVQDLIDRTAGRVVTGGKDWKSSGDLKGVMKILSESGALGSLK